ncbi:MAG TPA: hypothetical protein VFL97_04905 [Nitrococcus sp.]|nr:hypothetical protein [Nitrococcus sp.]
MRCGRKRPGGNWGVKDNNSMLNEYTTSAWQRLARLVRPEQLTARQALAVALIQCGIVATPEAALRLLDGGNG